MGNLRDRGTGLALTGLGAAHRIDSIIPPGGLVQLCEQGLSTWCEPGVFGVATVQSGSEAIATYIRAKDGNHPELMSSAFVESAVLEMVVHASSISFPPLTRGLGPITEVLVSRFGEIYEDVHTVCLSAPPEPSATTFSCPWLVGMSEKRSKAIRVGCGRYDWSFRPMLPRLVDRLTITIDLMQILPADSRGSVMSWIGGLPYPWCEARLAVGSAPRLELLEPIIRHLNRRA